MGPGKMGRARRNLRIHVCGPADWCRPRHWESSPRAVTTRPASAASTGTGLEPLSRWWKRMYSTPAHTVKKT